MGAKPSVFPAWQYWELILGPYAHLAITALLSYGHNPVFRFCLETWFHQVAQAGLELELLSASRVAEIVGL